MHFPDGNGKLVRKMTVIEVKFPGDARRYKMPGQSMRQRLDYSYV